MRSLILMQTDIYPEAIVYQSTNEFGDQVLTLITESKHGERLIITENRLEGNWIEFNEIELKKLFADQLSAIKEK